MSSFQTKKQGLNMPVSNLDQIYNRLQNEVSEDA